MRNMLRHGLFDAVQFRWRPSEVRGNTKPIANNSTSLRGFAQTARVFFF